MPPSTCHTATSLTVTADRGLSRIAGHRKDADAVRRTVEAAARCGIDVLTLYAFSSDNWRRPLEEVNAIMRLFRIYLEQETKQCAAYGVTGCPPAW